MIGELIGKPTRMKHLKAKNAKYVFDNKSDYIDDLWVCQSVTGPFQLMLKGAQDEEDIEVFLEPLMRFYQYAVIDNALQTPTRPDGQNKEELLALSGQL